MYLQNVRDHPEEYIVYDIETDGLIDYRTDTWPTKLWCGVFKNLGTEQVWEFDNKDGTRSAETHHAVGNFISEQLRENKIFVGHNILSYDNRVLRRLCGVDIPYRCCIDTLVLSYLYNPQLQGGHSLEAYGERLGIPKVQNEVWDQWSPIMLTRCRSDVDINILTLKALVQRMLRIGYSEKSCEIEHCIRHVINEQEHHGFWFDTVRARNLYQYLRDREADLSQQVHDLFPPELAVVAEHPVRFRKDGSYYASTERILGKYPKVEIENGIIKCYDWNVFNIGSPKQRIERMQSLGWEPVVFTKKKNPKLDEDSLLAYADAHNEPRIRAMAEWLVHNGRANMVRQWVDLVGPVDSRIHGEVFTCGAKTRRMRHTRPNTANVPAAGKALYGEECRSLWGVEPGSGNVLLGYDADGLENTTLCHYLHNPAATEVLVRPKPNDVHTLNAKLLTEIFGRPIDRNQQAKTCYYAWLYGAYPPKLGSIVGGDADDGQKVVDTFFKNVPGLKNLIDSIQEEWKAHNCRLRTIDGGSIICPSLNAALNFKIQSAGGITMKLASVKIFEESARLGLDQHKVGDIHDEGQHEVKEGDAEELGKLASASITAASEELGYTVPLTGSYTIGMNWAQTH